jgi:hypothetical protein
MGGVGLKKLLQQRAHEVSSHVTPGTAAPTVATSFLTLAGVFGRGSALRSPFSSETDVQRRDPSAWGWLYATAAVALTLRLVVAIWALRTGQADEVFQYLEQAHRLVYGYGTVPWEYRYGVRNWGLPLSLAGVLEMLRSLGLDTPSTYIPVMNSVVALLSVSIVFSNYTIVRNLFGERAGRIAAVIAAVWYELLHNSTTATPEVFASYAIMAGFALATDGRHKRAIWMGLLLGASVSLRPHYVFAAATVAGYATCTWGRGSLWRMGMAFSVIPAIAGALDYAFWGAPFSSYYNYFLFNGTYQMGDEFDPAPIFTFAPWLGYLGPLTILSFGLQPLALLYGAIHWRRCWPVLLLIGCVLLPHSLIGHKEYRFIFLMVPLFLILLADLVANWFSGTRWIPIPIGIGCALLVLTSGYVFARDDHLLAELDLSKRENVRAVIDLTEPWWKSGGFYYLHHDVPMYFAEDLLLQTVDDYRRLASHVILRGTAPAIPGFRIVARYHDVAVLEQISPPPSYQAPSPFLREPLQKGATGRVDPHVRRLL